MSALPLSLTTVTLDANCIINGFAPHATSTSVPELEQLIEAGQRGLVDLVVTTRLVDDLVNDPDKARLKALLERVKYLPVIGTIGRYGVTRYNSGDSYTDASGSQEADSISRLLFPGGIDPSQATYGNKQNDVDHLIGHKYNGRDIFVTDEDRMFRKRTPLQQHFRIVVMKPAEVLLLIQSKYGSIAPAPKPPPSV